MPYLDKKPDLIDDVTLKQIDQSVVNWFQNDFPVIIDSRKVPVIYATAERWARAQKEKGFRNESGTLTLPLISVRRTTPDPLVERYVPEHDETNITLVTRIATSPINEDRQSANVGNTTPDAEYMKVSDAVVYETLQIPFPSFVNLDYDVIVWTSYMTHQNLNQENIYRQWKAGRQWVKYHNYVFFAQLRSSTDQSNLDDFSDKEKMIKYGFKFLVQAYFVNKDEIKSFRTSSNTRIQLKEASTFLETGESFEDYMKKIGQK